MKYRKSEDHIEIEIGHTYDGKSLNNFFDDYKISRPKRYNLLQSGRVTIDGRVIKNNGTPLHNNMVISLPLESGDIDWKANDKPCTVVYENEFVYIVHKEPGIIIHSSCDDPNCLNGLAAKWQLDHNIHVPVRPIHRLDEDTAGLVFYSKVPLLQPWFDDQLAKKKISRQYLAIVTGKPMSAGRTFTCNRRIGKDRHNAGMYRVSSTGKEAFTTFECLAKKDDFLLIRCTLDTGRTHQIRVHLSYLGYPIVNDPLYGHPSHVFQNMGLWADTLTFHDPFSNKKHKIHDIDNRDYEYFKRT